jgi:hypothetical protein
MAATNNIELHGNLQVFNVSTGTDYFLLYVTGNAQDYKGRASLKMYLLNSAYDEVTSGTPLGSLALDVKTTRFRVYIKHGVTGLRQLEHFPAGTQMNVDGTNIPYDDDNNLALIDTVILTYGADLSGKALGMVLTASGVLSTGIAVGGSSGVPEGLAIGVMPHVTGVSGVRATGHIEYTAAADAGVLSPPEGGFMAKRFLALHSNRSYS